MKIKDLIEQLQGIETAHGDIEVTISCDQELHPDGPYDDVICTFMFEGEPGPNTLMLCDRYTFGELSS